MTHSPSATSPVRAAQYLRMSTDNQRYSLENQALLIARYAAERNIEVIQSYEDAGRSGVTTAGRDGLKALLKDVLSGQTPYNTILVVDVSRWGRFQDPDEAAHYEFICRSAGVKVEYCGEAFENDGSTSAVLIKHVKRIMAAEYSRQLSDRCVAGKRRVTLAGLVPGGATPFGLRRQAFNPDGSPGPVLQVGERRPRLEQTIRYIRGPEEETAIIRLIFKLFVTDRTGLSAVADILNERGLTFSNGAQWKFHNVRSILRSETSIGFTVFNKVSGQFYAPRSRKPPEAWMRVKVLDPIISVSLFKAAQQKLSELHGHTFTRTELLDQLRILLAREGRLTSTVINSGPFRAKARVYKDRFGTMKAAYDLIGYSPSRKFRMMEPDAYARDAIIEKVKSLHRQHGFLTWKMIWDAPGLPSADYLTKMFGGAMGVYAAAGIVTSKSDLQRAGWARLKSRAASAATSLALLD